MKKLRNIIFIIVSITSLVAECQNNLNESTKTILDNAQNLHKKLNAVPLEDRTKNSTLSVEQIIKLLLMQEKLKDSDLLETLENKKKSYNQLQIAALWFEQPRKIFDWIEYLAIHNQMFTSIQKELNELKSVPQQHDFCKQIGQRIITVFINVIVLLYADTKVSKDDFASLIYAYQDYVKLFKNYVQIDNDAITEILKKEGLSW